MAAKSKKWKYTVELPSREDCSDKIAKEKVQIAVAAAFSLAAIDVKVSTSKPATVAKTPKK